VSKSSFPWIIVIILVIGLAVGHVLGLILAALGLVVAYGISLRLHPRMRHGRCNGTGEVKGSVFVWTHRKCPGTVCQGGRQIRWGAGLWGAEHIRSERERARQAKLAAREGNRWR
jgi:hypothetical protein